MTKFVCRFKSPEGAEKDIVIEADNEINAFGQAINVLSKEGKRYNFIGCEEL